MDCPFCAIVQGRAPASVVAETERAVAFMDFRQMLPGHVLVVPRAHVENIYALDVEDAAAVTALAARAARALRPARGVRPARIEPLAIQRRRGQPGSAAFSSARTAAALR
ncbi:HIT family protein [Luteimonas sp. SX5]|uniref:HIT family protein n=1 Tax=Luteimonas galliterrae TaxID=2940486 RepID=A0ABT0MKR1_9GAMM|nr:HIT family protein [Luteimonas galliterrae]